MRAAVRRCLGSGRVRSARWVGWRRGVRLVGLGTGMNGGAALWPSPWPAEDGGPRRLQVPVATQATGPGWPNRPGLRLDVTHREAVATTMVVLREPGEVFVLRHGLGDDVGCWVERIDPLSLEVLARSVDLPGGPMWPGGMAVHANGDLHVVFGRHAHRLSAQLEVRASAVLPRPRPYNSFVTLPDGHLVTKDFGGQRPTQASAPPRDPAELLVLDPLDLAVVASAVLPEPSIARLSADGDDVYVVGDTSLLRVRWDPVVRSLEVDDGFVAPYRTLPGQTYGWDAVIALGAAWFLDDGEGSHRFDGSLRGHGSSAAPLHVVRVDLTSAAVSLTEVCGLPGGLVANPPAVDERRRIVVGYDSGNGVVAAFDVDLEGRLSPRWRRDQDHGCHPLLFPDTGVLITADHDRERMADEVVVLDVETGTELGRADTGSPLQSVVFPAVGWHDDVYCTSLSTLSRVSLAAG